MLNQVAAVVMLLPMSGAKGGGVSRLTYSAPLDWCDALARTASAVAHITRRDTSPERSLAIMPDAKL
eukprot:8389007-Pyramimonas_sp.AAC.1